MLGNIWIKTIPNLSYSQCDLFFFFFDSRYEAIVGHHLHLELSKLFYFGYFKLKQYAVFIDYNSTQRDFHDQFFV